MIILDITGPGPSRLPEAHLLEEVIRIDHWHARCPLRQRSPNPNLDDVPFEILIIRLLGKRRFEYLRYRGVVRHMKEDIASVNSPAQQL